MAVGVHLADRNSCNVNKIDGYDTLPATVPNIKPDPHYPNAVYNFPDTGVSCAPGYSSAYKQAVYSCWNTNPSGANIDINPESCEQEKFYEVDQGEFNEGAEPIFSSQEFFSNGNYNIRHLRVEYGRWWDGCDKVICKMTYDKTNNNDIGAVGIGNWELKVGNGICGDPIRNFGKKAYVSVGYCLRNHCSD